MKIKVPSLSTLFELHRYVDEEAGNLEEYVSLDLKLPNRYMGEVMITAPGLPPRQLRFPIAAANLREALTNWEVSLKAAFDEIASQQLRAELAGGSHDEPDPKVPKLPHS